ncbi:unnamed protein product [Mucor fragilis]
MQRIWPRTRDNTVYVYYISLSSATANTTSNAPSITAPSSIVNNSTNSTMTIQTMNNSGRVFINNENAPSSASSRMAGNKRKAFYEELFHPNELDTPPPKRDSERRAAGDEPAVNNDALAVGNEPVANTVSAADTVPVTLVLVLVFDTLLLLRNDTSMSTMYLIKTQNKTNFSFVVRGRQDQKISKRSNSTSKHYYQQITWRYNL